jgi:arylsulfatase A-like enzyme
MRRDRDIEGLARRSVLRARLSGLGLACLGLLGVVGRLPAQQRPNIVLLMADDQGYGDVAYHGHPHLKTPVLDEMAATGLRFDRFYAAHPVCSPTRGSVMTGRHPNRFACFSWGHTLRPEEVTVAEALQSAGYATGHFGKWHLGSCRSDDDVSPGRSGFDQWVSSPNFYENSPLLSDKGRVIQTEGESSEVTVRLAVRFMDEQAAAKRPFLAVIWFGNPHSPHEATADLRALYPDQKPALQNYYGEITGIDRAVGLLRSELKRLGVAEQTLVWYTSDNGAQGPGSTGGLRGKKGSLWEGGVRVPGLIEWPQTIRAPRVIAAPASTSDIYPTLLELAGAKPAHQPPLDGVSLLPLIAGEPLERPRPICFWVHPTPGIRTPSAEWLKLQRDEQTGARPATAAPKRTAASLMVEKFPDDHFPGHSACVAGDWKLHRIAKGSEKPAFELYNLADDPAETRDLATDEPSKVAALQGELERWLGSVVQSLNGEDYPAP